METTNTSLSAFPGISPLQQLSYIQSCCNYMVTGDLKYIPSNHQIFTNNSTTTDNYVVPYDPKAPSIILAQPTPTSTKPKSTLSPESALDSTSFSPQVDSSYSSLQLIALNSSRYLSEPSMDKLNPTPLINPAIERDRNVGSSVKRKLDETFDITSTSKEATNEFISNVIGIGGIPVRTAELIDLTVGNSDYGKEHGAYNWTSNLVRSRVRSGSSPTKIQIIRNAIPLSDLLAPSGNIPTGIEAIHVQNKVTNNSRLLLQNLLKPTSIASLPIHQNILQHYQDTQPKYVEKIVTDADIDKLGKILIEWRLNSGCKRVSWIEIAKIYGNGVSNTECYYTAQCRSL